MPNQILDALIAHLREELAQINQAILVLEQMAIAKRAHARRRVRRKFSVHVNKTWTKHRVVAD
jgi:predicted aminopeptidase